MGSWMQIGEFARSCRLSVKALRHYDELGLLRPDHIDAETGYRYYRREQARTAIAIAMLRSIGLPLPSVREILDGQAAFDDVLERERARLAREEARVRQALRSVEHLMRAGALMPYQAVMRDEPARDVVVHAGRTTAETHVEDTSALVFALLEALDRAGLRYQDPVGSLLPEGMDESFAIEVYATVAEPRSVRGLELRRVAACTCAVVTHTGAYESLGLAHHALRAWTEEHGYRAAGVVREVYVSDPRTVAEASLITEVLLPVEPAGATLARR